MSLDVVCPSCGGKYHETNDEDGFMKCEHTGKMIPNPAIRKYDPDKPTNGAMLRLKEKYKRLMWSSFPNAAHVIADVLECPDCGSPYCGTRRNVRTVDQFEVAEAGIQPKDILAPEEMRSIRVKKGLSQSQLGDIIGVKQAMVSAFETGKLLLPYTMSEKLRALANA